MIYYFFSLKNLVNQFLCITQGCAINYCIAIYCNKYIAIYLLRTKNIAIYLLDFKSIAIYCNILQYIDIGNLYCIG